MRYGRVSKIYYGVILSVVWVKTGVRPFFFDFGALCFDNDWKICLIFCCIADVLTWCNLYDAVNRQNPYGTVSFYPLFFVARVIQSSHKFNQDS